ncbi:cell wall-binding repeat-containing protein [Mobiluncus curtisii]|uniref:Cell wall-binding repeat-containing protein n=1 Tax=Mobiluncus curtisii TaxID=2051 RepID=A0A7Y0UHK7_9ACTO|nr:cell wall-binding repeat-containing protein [Mobiluncus curtisii]MCU9986555.1 cell wall-binding repeat-containing protein [Mobiluncus curtisii]MCV0000270.1 cell wall-binding repeat-containing protein [Mobiluncus curtisii]NMW48841.1 cell wall-binding repeat-containing protein [Mobiluncus curtisii]NMW87292.1 cell wall-binding repeat-containing protein [Mobiluncus curtisii]NMX12885.1 cell wall-binding repeat-containing protein [Mobiluncus curtisii]
MIVSIPSFPSRFSRVGAGFAMSALALAGLMVPLAQGRELGETQTNLGCLAQDRLGGQNAIETSGLVAAQAYPEGSQKFLVASARNPVDALPAAALGWGPVLLTDGLNWDLHTLATLNTAYIVGGPGAVPASAEMFFAEHGIEHHRIQGADRHQTAAAIAESWASTNGQPEYVYVTRNAGAGSPDAVAAAGVRNGPILTFTTPASRQAAAAKIHSLKPRSGVVILGGAGVVSDAEAQVLAGGLPWQRLGGQDRYETSWVIANWILQSKSRSHIYLASGHALKDAMVAGAFNDGVILLTPPDGSRIFQWANEINADGITVIGGRGVVSDTAAHNAACGKTPGVDEKVVANLLYPSTEHVCTTETWDSLHSRGLIPSMPSAPNACWMPRDRINEQVKIVRQSDFDQDGFGDAVVYLYSNDGTSVYLVLYNAYDPAHPYVAYLWGGNGDWDFRITDDPFATFDLIANGEVVRNLAVIRNHGVPEMLEPVG